jgi:hypothetical protein
MLIVIAGGAVAVAVAALEEAGAVPPQDVIAQTRAAEPANEILDTQVPRIPINKPHVNPEMKKQVLSLAETGTIFRKIASGCYGVPPPAGRPRVARRQWLERLFSMRAAATRCRISRAKLCHNQLA